MILYIINIILFLVLIFMIILLLHGNKKLKGIKEYLNSILTAINSVRYGNLSAKMDKTEPLYQNITDSINRMVETLNDREKMIVEYQNELMQQNNLLESTINSLSDGIVVTDKDANILKITPKISKWFNEEYKQIIGKNICDYIDIQTDNLDNLSCEIVVIKQSLSQNFVISSKKIQTGENDIQIAFLIKDITNEKEVETLKENFVATLTHDLKVPIIAEANMLEFFLESKFGEINEKQKTALLNMQASNKELLELVQILLESYKIKEKGVALFKENIELNSFVKTIIDEMQPIASKYNIIINFESSQQPNLDINADKIQMTRVIKNLLSNAILHSDTKEKADVKLDVDNDYAYISITDYGKGIDEKNINLIFDKYYSADKFHKTGTGLGLYLSRQIVLSHGGEITVTSEENVKTTFCIKLPL